MCQGVAQVLDTEVNMCVLVFVPFVAQDNTELRARLIVAADGSTSRIRQLAGFRTFGWKYNQRAVVATVQLEGAQRLIVFDQVDVKCFAFSSC